MSMSAILAERREPGWEKRVCTYPVTSTEPLTMVEVDVSNVYEVSKNAVRGVSARIRSAQSQLNNAAALRRCMVRQFRGNDIRAVRIRAS